MSQNSIVLPTTGTVSGLTMTNDINAALDTLNTLSSGASAPSSPEAGQWWHDTTNNQLKIRNLANNAWIIIGTLDEVNNLFSSNTIALPPQGRLTLTNSTPIMTGDATAQTSIYYTNYIGNLFPVYNGSSFTNSSFNQLILTLNSSNHLSGKLYDTFGFLNSGTLTIAAGPAWTNLTTRSAALAQINGLWVNNASINLTNSSTTYSSIAANRATYLGTFYATANGQTGVSLRPSAAAGGTNNIIGIFNAYNRQRVMARSLDSTASWTYASGTVRPANNSTSNRVSFIDGLAQINIDANYVISIADSAGAGYPAIGFNSAAAIQDVQGLVSGTSVNSASAFLSNYPVLGFNFVQALESTDGTTATFYGQQGTQNMGLFLNTEF